MKKLTVIKINRFQLNILLNPDQKEVYEYLLNQGVYCNSCGENCSKGVQVEEMYLNALNDIMIHGKCKSCNGKVTKIMEFGENKDFFDKAIDFRNSIKV
jgi:hypothetical protein